MSRVTKGFVAAVVIFALNESVWACPWCRIQVRGGIYDENFVSTLLMLLLPIFVLATIAIGLHHADKISEKIRRLKKWLI